MSRVLGLYVARLYVALFAAMWAGVVVLYLVADFGDWLRLYVDHPVFEVALLYWYKSHIALQQFAPAAMVLAAGAAATLVRRRGEWTAMQSLGFSRWMLVFPMGLSALLIAGALVVFDDRVASEAGNRVDKLMAERFSRWGDFSTFYSPKSWFRVGPYVIHVRGESGGDGTLREVTVLEVGPNFELIRRFEAERMVPVAGPRWALSRVVEWQFNAQDSSRVERAERVLELPGTSPDTFRIQLGRPERMRLKDLYEQQAARARVALSTNRFWYAIHNRFAYPLSGLAGAMLALLLALRPGRKGGLASALMEGATVYLVLFACTMLGKALVLGEHLSPGAAAWAPVLGLLVGSAGAWRGQRPG